MPGISNVVSFCEFMRESKVVFLQLPTAMEFFKVLTVFMVVCAYATGVSLS